MTLNKDGLEAARNAVGTIPGAALWSAVEKAITAYLSVLPAPDGLVERLRADAAQLIRMSKATEFGKDLSVRVKAPDLLIASLTEAATVIQTLQRERDEADNALVDKYRDPKTGTFNFPGDVAAIVRRLEAAEQQVWDMRAALRKIEGHLQSSIDTHEFNARHMIAEDSLQDAWKMLDLAREQFQVDANALRIPLATARLLLKEGGE